jgi:hypothetical protein
MTSTVLILLSVAGAILICIKLYRHALWTSRPGLWDTRLNFARCRHCERRIRRCLHTAGAPSQLEHCHDGSHFCAGKIVEHA